MSVPDAIRLLILAIIWGASFLFLRIASPEFGPIPLIFLRAVIATLCIGVVFRRPHYRALFRKHLGKFFFLGVVNTALPFSLLAYSTLSLEVGFTALLNATTPIFAAIVGAAVYSTPLRKLQIVGLFVALGGVAILSWDSLSFKPGGSGLAVVAALVASVSYGVAVNVTKHHLTDIPPMLVSAGTLLTTIFILMIPGIWLWPKSTPSTGAWLSALLLGAVCTAVAYALFFNLLTRSGAMAASSVTFLIPVFAILWGTTIGERIDAQLFIGMLVTLAGTALAVGLLNAESWKSRRR